MWRAHLGDLGDGRSLSGAEVTREGKHVAPEALGDEETRERLRVALQRVGELGEERLRGAPHINVSGRGIRVLRGERSSLDFGDHGACD